MAVELDRNHSELGWQRRPSGGVSIREGDEQRESGIRDLIITGATLARFTGVVARTGASMIHERLREKVEPIFPNGTRKERLEAWGAIEALHAEHDLGQLVYQGAFEYTADAQGRIVSRYDAEARTRHYLSVVMGTLPDEPAGTPDELLILDQFGTSDYPDTTRFFRVNGDPDVHAWGRDDVYYIGQTLVKPTEIRAIAATLEAQV